MRAVIVNEYGGVPVVAEVPTPQLAPRLALIKREAAGVNPIRYRLLARLADALVARRIAAPSITRIKLAEAPDTVSGTDPRRSDGTTVIV
jgi:NADPH:quinone reductase-like Zn-dependent oxidoreductase